MDLPATCSITLDLVRVMDVPKSENHQFSPGPRSSKAGRVCGACTSRAGHRRQTCNGAFWLPVDMEVVVMRKKEGSERRDRGGRRWVRGKRLALGLCWRGKAWGGGKSRY